MKKQNHKKMIKIDKIDSFIGRYREDIRIQEELEKKRKATILNYLFKKEKT